MFGQLLIIGYIMLMIGFLLTIKPLLLIGLFLTVGSALHILFVEMPAEESEDKDEDM